MHSIALFLISISLWIGGCFALWYKNHYLVLLYRKWLLWSGSKRVIVLLRNKPSIPGRFMLRNKTFYLEGWCYVTNLP